MNYETLVTDFGNLIPFFFTCLKSHWIFLPSGNLQSFLESVFEAKNYRGNVIITLRLRNQYIGCNLMPTLQKWDGLCSDSSKTLPSFELFPSSHFSPGKFPNLWSPGAMKGVPSPPPPPGPPAMPFRHPGSGRAYSLFHYPGHTMSAFLLP